MDDTAAPKSVRLETRFQGVFARYVPSRKGRPIEVRFRVPTTGRFRGRWCTEKERATVEEWARDQLASYRAGVIATKKADMETLAPAYIQVLHDRLRSETYITDVKADLTDLQKHGLKDLAADNALELVQHYLRTRTDHKKRPALPMPEGRKFKVSREARVKAMVEACDGNKRQAAAKLGITRKTLYRYLNMGKAALEPQPISNATKAKILRSLSGLVTYANATKRLIGNPFAALDVQRKEAGETEAPPVFTLDEVRRLVNASAELRKDPMWLATMVYLYAGLRDREGTWIKWSHIAFEGKRILIRKPTLAEKKAGKRVKRNKSRNARLLAELAAMLREWAPQAGAPDDFVLPERFRRMSNARRNDWLAKLCERCGVTIKDRTLHSLRHTNASILNATGLGDIALRDHLGHAKVDMSAHYAQHADLMREQVKHWPQGEFCFVEPAPPEREASKTPAPTIVVKPSAPHIVFGELEIPQESAKTETTKPAELVFSGELDWPDKEKDEEEILLADPELVVIEDDAA